MSSDPRWERLEALFDAALAWPAARRSAWLAEACADDPALRDEVQRMLDAHEHPGGGILDRQAVPRAVPRDVVAPHPAELARRIEDALAAHYIVERELGRGGMATVYLAHERKHERRVVLKVLNPEVAARWGAERFTREVQIAARLAHPNIVGLIDSGTADGLFYYVMPYVAGETLRDRIARVGALPVAEALALLRDVAGALAHAHHAGVVHRDLKPANVLCAGEHAFLMDFGVAKLLTPTTGHGPLTEQGVALGTPAYMAPEQRAPAEGQVDHRVDLYAWGLLAYEMLTGRLPDAAATHDAATTATPVPVRARRAEVPRELSALVDACLAPDPARRIASADALVDRLVLLETPSGGSAARGAHFGAAARARRRLALALGGGVAVVALGAAWAVRTRTPAVLAEDAAGAPVAVAVLRNETGDPSLDSWGRMAGDWMTQGLQEAGGVRVVSWPSALQASERVRAERAAGRPVNEVQALRDETGAGMVVTGQYYLVGDSLQFRVELTDTRTLRSLAAPQPVSVARDSVHLAVRDLRERLQSLVAIQRNPGLAPVPGLTRRPPRFEAYQAFEYGLERYLEQDYRGAAPEMRRAYAADTTFLVPLVYAVTASLNTEQYAQAESTLAVLEQRLGELSPYHTALVEAYRAQLAGDAQHELLALERAGREVPGSRAWYNYAMLAIEMDMPREALVALQRLDPDRGEMRGWSSYFTQLTHAHHLLGQHAQELAAARALRVRHPDRRVAQVLEARALAVLGDVAALDSLFDAMRALPPTTYWSLGGAMVVAGSELLAHHGDEARGRAYLEQAMAWFAQQRALSPDFEAHREWLGEALYQLGRWAEAAEQYEALVRLEPENPRYRGTAAVLAARLGHPDPERILGPAEPHDRGRHAVYLARIAAVRGDRERAAALLADAVTLRVDGLAWMHTTAYRDLTLLAEARGALPVTLRVR